MRGSPVALTSSAGKSLLTVVGASRGGSQKAQGPMFRVFADKLRDDLAGMDAAMTASDISPPDGSSPISSGAHFQRISTPA